MMMVRPAPMLRGDPGLFGSIGRALGGAVSGFVRGGPLGAITGAASAITRPQARPGGALVMQQPQFQQPTPGFIGAVQRFAPGGATGFQGSGTQCLKRDGTPRRIRQDGKCYKRPSMNFGNVRAASRAITRIKGVRKVLKRIESALPKSSLKAKGKRCGCK